MSGRMGFVTLFLLFSIPLQAQIKEIELSNPGIRSSIEKYTTYLKTNGFDKHHLNHIVIRIDQIEEPRLVYILGVSSISFFLSDVPQYYYRYRTRIVFVYIGKTPFVQDTTRFGLFFDQFGNDFELDVNRDGTVISKNGGWIKEIGGWRVVLSNERVKSVKATIFPTSSFYVSHDYDGNGNVIYKDGILDDISLTPYHAQTYGHLDLRDYILKNTKISKDSLSVLVGKRRNVIVLMVIDESGKVVEACVNGIKDAMTRMEIEQALQKMPAWKPATLSGKRVKVRTRVTL